MNSNFFTSGKKIHFTGIKGVGMTALALCAQDCGVKVSGSDTKECFITDKVLEKNGLTAENFSPENITSDLDLLVFTAAHNGEENLEVKKALKLGIPVLSHAQALGQITRGKKLIATCGVGGKSTTAAMLATILAESGQQFSYAVGVGEICPLGNPGKFNKNSQLFVAEADEYFSSPKDKKPRFSYLQPEIVILTNIEHDHPDVYQNLTATKKAFTEFINKIPPKGLLIVNIDNKNNRAMLNELKVPFTTYGFSRQADWQIAKLNIKINMPGDYNLANAAASYVAADFLGIPADRIKQALATFCGTKRRLEKIWQIRGITLYDDYAHHPCEIKAVTQALKARYPQKRLIVIFQPHTYSRTKKLFKEFIDSFSYVNLVLITQIYASKREKKDLSISGLKLTQALEKKQPASYFMENDQAIIGFLKKNLQKGDILLTLGAGDIFKLHDKIKQILK